MIRFEHVTITYADAPAPGAARRRPHRSPRASSASSSGRTGSGKSTFLGAINGLVPALHRRPPRRPGRRRRSRHPRPTRPATWPTSWAWWARTRWPASSPTPWRRSWPTPWSSSPCPSRVMRKRVEETLDLLGIAELRDRALRTLSGGQQQRVAIGSVLTAAPARSSCSTSRPRRSTPPRPRRCSPPSPGSSTTSASPS